MGQAPKTVAYYYDDEVGNVNYGGGNPMRPHRVRLTHTLVETYGLSKNLLVHRPQHCTEGELASFHADGEALARKLATSCRRCTSFGCEAALIEAPVY